jgi:urease accessory protein
MPPSTEVAPRSHDGYSDAGSAALSVSNAMGDRLVVDLLRSTGALAFRPTPWGAWLVGTAAHPLGGDRLKIEVTAGEGCQLDVRSLSATVARRGPIRPRQSAMIVKAQVSDYATLRWATEPGVAASGADHRSETELLVSNTARIAWRDEFVLGRFGEDPGTWRSRMSVIVDRTPVLISELAAGPAAAGWTSSAVLAGARAVCSMTIVDPNTHAATAVEFVEGTSVRGTALPLTGAGVQFSAWGDRLAECRHLVAKLMAQVPDLSWATGGPYQW